MFSAWHVRLKQYYVNRPQEEASVAASEEKKIAMTAAG